MTKQSIKERMQEIAAQYDKIKTYKGHESFNDLSTWISAILKLNIDLYQERERMVAIMGNLVTCCENECLAEQKPIHPDSPLGVARKTLTDLGEV